VRGTRTIAQWFCLIGGALLILRGTVGVAMDPDFGAPGEGWHQLFHLVSGMALVAASPRPGPALVLTFAFAASYAAITLAGFADGADVAGILPVETSDNRLHSLFTVGSLAVGIAALSRARFRSGRPA
jgi:hypothetical protein